MKIIEDGTVTNPKGYKGAGLHIGIKKRNKDFALIVSDVEAKAVGTFTTNMVKAAPVLWDKQVVENSDTVKAIAINSGIANACTGKLGEEARKIRKYCRKCFKCRKRKSIDLFNRSHW